MPLSPQEVKQLLHQARSAHQVGRLAAAKRAYHELLEHSPDNPTVSYLLGVIALQESDYISAIQLIEKVISVVPNKAPCYVNLAIAYGYANQQQKALAACHKAIELSPELVSAYYNLGLLHERFANIEAACDAFQATLDKQPQHIGALTKLISYAIRSKQLTVADSLVKQLHHLHPEEEQTYFYQGLLAENQGNISQAQASYQHIVNKDTTIAGAYNNLASLYYQQNDFVKANHFLEKGLAKYPNHSELLFNKVTVLRNQGEYKAAIDILKTILAQAPEHALAHFCLSELYLLLGDFVNGWPEYIWRRRLTNIPKIEQPALWQGESLKNKKLWVLAEQGIGDCIQYMRFFTLLAKKGAKITFSCPSALMPLLKSRQYKCIDDTDDIQPDQFDYHIPIASIPAVLQIDNICIPNKTPYIKVPRVAQWRNIRKQHSAKRHVGLVWRDSQLHPNDKRRSLTLNLLQKVTEKVPDTSFYLLQAEPTVNERAQLLPANMYWPSSESLTLVDAATIIQQLDLVISIDTDLAHLAGALACPVWMLLPFSPDWRWQLERDDTPWYPNMRLFRQPKPFAWDAVLQAINNALIK